MVMIAAEYVYKTCVNNKRVIENNIFAFRSPNAKQNQLSQAEYGYCLQEESLIKNRRRQGIREKVVESELFSKCRVKDDNAYRYLLIFF